MLALFSFLHRSEHEYIVRYDDAGAFWGDSSQEFVMNRVSLGIDFLLSKGVDVIIVSPIVELLLNSWTLDYISKIQILPLFSRYVLDECLPFSLVGKIGFMGDYLDVKIGQDLLKKLTANLVLTDNQRGIKKFHFPLAWWGKEVRLWNPLLENLSWSSTLLNTLIKNDLKYFKNAAVDTVIPMNYSYFWVQKTLQHLFNFNKTRFHGIEKLETVFQKLVTGKSSTYKVSVFHTGHGEFLTRNKRLLWLLDKWKSGKVDIAKI